MSAVPANGKRQAMRQPLISYAPGIRERATSDAALAELDKDARAAKYLELQNKIVTEVICWVPIAQHTITMGAVKG